MDHAQLMKLYSQRDREAIGHPATPDTTILYGHNMYFSGWNFNPILDLCTEQEIAQEIEERLKIFGLPRHLIEMSKEGTIYLNKRGRHHFLEGEALELARQIEREYNVKVYYAYYEETNYSMDAGYRFFFIDHDKENWQFDHVDLMIHDPMCFKYRISQGKKLLYAQPLGDSYDHIGLYWKEM